KEAFRILGLNGMFYYFDEVLKQATTEELSYSEFIKRLLEKENDWKEENRVNRWTQQAHFELDKTFKDYDFTFPKSINKRKVKELSTSVFIENGQNIAFFGPTGVGKTHLACSTGKKAIDNGFDVRFLKLKDLKKQLDKIIDNGENLHGLSMGLLRPKLLILDEMDLYESSNGVGEFLADLLTSRHQQKISTIFTANQTFPAWMHIFGNQLRGETVIDRIMENCIVIEIDGLSYRLHKKLRS
ncbi:ATP-binding protein, partial [Candidatus Microgenomates bacterium]|nr:ATP-binding protein [Candidatus Microgenomates bacterium]